MVGLRDGLQDLGYRENDHFVLGVRFTQGDIAALPSAAHELVQYGVDLIYTSDTFAAKAAQQATSHIPIVFAVSDDPVKQRLVESFARPGGNITGVTSLYTDLSPKRLEIFREIVPGLKRVLFLYDAGDSLAEVEARG
jgi:putative ABC transport system substrate-binding protein